MSWSAFFAAWHPDHPLPERQARLLLAAIAQAEALRVWLEYLPLLAAGHAKAGCGHAFCDRLARLAPLTENARIG